MKKVMPFLIVVLTNATTSAQNSSTHLHQQIDSLIQAEIQKYNVPGVSLVVLKDGKIDYIKGYGYANLEHKVPVKPETIFQSGSIGKQFAAFAIMQLVEEGKIKLTDKLTRFFPDAPPSWDSITVENLLNHTSGFGEYMNNFNLRGDYTEDSLYRIFRTKPMLFSPGENSAYSNMGYVTLGIIIRKVTGKFYGTFLKERIFEPLGMTTARIISEQDIVLNRASGYQLKDGIVQNQEWVSPSVNTTADGSMYLTALDMAKWEAALNDGKLLKKESYELMWSPTKLNNGTYYPYGFGWQINTIQNQKIIEHAGTWQGFQSMIKRYPKEKNTVIIFANLLEAEVNRMATRIMEFHHPELIVPKLKPIADHDPQVKEKVKDLIQKITDLKATSDMFTPEFGQAFLPMIERASAYLKRQGNLIDLELLGRKDVDEQNKLHHYRLIFSKEQMELKITITKEGKISMLEAR